MMIGKPFDDCYEPCPTSGCWLWTESLSSSGYGTKTMMGKTELAHRLSWRLNRGSLRKGIQVLHRCDVPSCVNPEHLFLGTQTQNLADAKAKGRAPQLEQWKFCKRGHPLIAENICIEFGGAVRRCLQCRTASRLAYRERKEAKE